MCRFFLLIRFGGVYEYYSPFKNFKIYPDILHLSSLSLFPNHSVFAQTDNTVTTSEETDPIDHPFIGVLFGDYGQGIGGTNWDKSLPIHTSIDDPAHTH
jgi:hypothetical protein